MEWPWKKRQNATQMKEPADACAADEPADITQPSAGHAQKPEKRPTDSLTPRERDVFELLIQGKKLREVAEVLGIKYSTVNTHQKSVYKKLGVNSRAECILRYALPEKRTEAT